MISSNANDKLQISDGAQVGFQDAKGPSNIKLNLSDTGNGILKDIISSSDAAAKIELDKSVDMIFGASAGGVRAGTTPVAGLGAGEVCVKGYVDLNVDANKKIYFVPLRPSAKPHMLSGTEFSSTAPQLATTPNPISNSFFTKGKMKEENSNNMLDFASIALAEPVDPAYSLSIPRGFIKVKNWKGFSVENTVLERNTNDNATRGNSNGRRGLHAAEYANHELLMARSDYDGPNHGTDLFSNLMDDPFYGLTTGGPQGTPILNDAGQPVFGKQSDIAKLIENNTKVPPVPVLDPLDKTCDGAFSTELPASTTCADIKDNNTSVADVSVAIDGNGNLVSVGDNQGPLSLAIVDYLKTKELDDDQFPWGSDIHPHIWSVDPQKVSAIDNPTNFMKTTDDPADPYKWMYTGILMMPGVSDSDGNHFGRTGNATSKVSPITWGTPGTLWQYLQDPDPSTNNPNAVSGVLSRLTQRILEIKPDFDAPGQLQTLLSMHPIDMHQDAYIYMDPTTKNMTMTVVKGDDTNFTVVAGSALPTFLQDEVRALSGNIDGKVDGVLGKTTFYGVARKITSQPNGADYIENVKEDWDYDTPYENADNVGGAQMVEVFMSNKYVFRPCTGYQGQLAVLELKSFIHHGACNTVNYNTPATPEQCPCVTFPEGSFPANPQPTPNTPNGWNQGTNDTDTALPNCSHTGAC